MAAAQWMLLAELLVRVDRIHAGYNGLCLCELKCQDVRYEYWRGIGSRSRLMNCES